MKSKEVCEICKDTNNTTLYKCTRCNKSICKFKCTVMADEDRYSPYCPNCYIVYKTREHYIVNIDFHDSGLNIILDDGSAILIEVSDSYEVSLSRENVEE